MTNGERPNCGPASARCWGREGKALSCLASGLQDGRFLAEAPEGILLLGYLKGPSPGLGALSVPLETHNIGPCL